MAIVLCMYPNDVPMSWERFRQTKPPLSVALDGYVSGAPQFDHTGPWANFNHHEDVDSLATRATCGQVLIAIRLRLFSCFCDDQGNPHINIFMHDCDEDICTAVSLLKHHNDVTDHMFNPLLDSLVNMEDILDSTAGAYPYPPDLPALKELAWIFHPYRKFRLIGGVERKDADEFTQVITDVDERIQQYLKGEAQSMDLDIGYVKIGGGHNWSMVHETGAQARTGMFADGIDAYVSVRERPDSRYTYTIGRMSKFIPFDIPRIINVLNQIEGTTDDRWGGGNTVGGSPRVGGSKLTPHELEKIINDIVGHVNSRSYSRGLP